MNYKKQIEEYGRDSIKLTENQLQEFVEDTMATVESMIDAANSVAGITDGAIGYATTAQSYSNPDRYLCVEIALIRKTDTEEESIEIGHGEVFSEEDYKKLIVTLQEEKDK
jgi:dissimilatory sulfite reductase (desulfoviridin) alpha/beta subunit